MLNTTPLVTKPVYKFDCHEGEVNAVKYHKSGKYFATGGGDRKIKLWEYRDGKCDLMSTLIGSNASIASIDIDNEVCINDLNWVYFINLDFYFY